MGSVKRKTWNKKNPHYSNLLASSCPRLRLFSMYLAIFESAAVGFRFGDLSQNSMPLQRLLLASRCVFFLYAGERSTQATILPKRPREFVRSSASWRGVGGSGGPDDWSWNNDLLPMRESEWVWNEEFVIEANFMIGGGMLRCCCFFE